MEKSLKFYIIDDDSDLIEMMTALLEAAGHTVFADIAAVPAISRIVSKRPDCIVTDLVMAEMDGLHLCRELRDRAELKDATIVMVSRKTDDHWRKRASEAGADGFIAKPLDPETFVSEVELIVAQSADREPGENDDPRDPVPGRR